MYFFRVEISSFDDAAKTLFIIPEQNADEQGVPFEERFLTMTAEYKAFIKETATSMVDGTYTQFACEERYESISEELFGQLQAEGKLTELDSNSFSISTGFKPKKSGGGKKDMKMYLIIGAFALVLVLLLIVSAAVGGNQRMAREYARNREVCKGDCKAGRGQSRRFSSCNGENHRERG